MNAGQHVEAFRFVAWTLEIGCVIVAAHYFIALRRFPDMRIRTSARLRISLGLAVKCFGWALHQFYWWIWQHAVVTENAQLKSDIEAWSALTIFAYIPIFLGEVLVISPWAEHVAGRRWPWLMAATVAVLWMIGAGFAHL